MKSVSPVFTQEEVVFETEIAKDQNQYVGVIGLPVTLHVIDPKNPDVKKIVPNWAIAVRFRLSDEERAQVAASLDLVVTQLTFGKQLAPMNFQLCEAGKKPVFEMRDEPPAPVKNALAEPMPSEATQIPEGTSNVLQMPEPQGEPLGSSAFEADHAPAEDATLEERN